MLDAPGGPDGGVAQLFLDEVPQPVKVVVAAAAAAVDVVVPGHALLLLLLVVLLLLLRVAAKVADLVEGGGVLVHQGEALTNNLEN